MKTSTPLAKVVAEALLLGVHRTDSVAEFKLILFLARSEGGSWTVGGRFPSVEDGLLWRIDMKYEAFRTAIRKLIRSRVVTSQRLGHTTTYSLSHQFLSRCRTLYEIRFDLAAIECYHNREGVRTPSGRVYVHQWEGVATPSPYRAQEEHGMSATADAGRPDGRPEEPTQEGTPMERNIDWDDDKPKRPKKGGWGGTGEVVLGADTTAPMTPKVVKHSPPRSKAVLALMEYFQSKLLAFSDSRHVPLWGVVGKAKRNIDFMLKQGHDHALIEGAIDFYMSQVPNLMFQGTSLWDQFFARRDEYIKFAASAGIGSHGVHTETQDEEARRLAAIRYRDTQQDRSK